MTTLAVRLWLLEHRLQLFGGLHVRWWHRPFRWLGDFSYRSRRWIQGARSITVGKYEDTCGSVDDDGIDLPFGGACPVQGDGEVDGRIVYYRSRGEGWQFHVAPVGSDDVFAADAWEYGERPYFFPDGGWVPASISQSCIRKAIAKWRAEGRP